MRRVRLLLVAMVAMFLLAGCGVKDETAEAIALAALCEGDKIILSEHYHGPRPPFVDHVFVGKTADGQVFYIRIRGEKIVKFLRENLPLSS